MVKIRIKNIEMYGHKIGEIINLGNKPVQKWRNAIKDSKIDGNIEIINELSPKNKSKKVKTRGLNNDNNKIS